MAGFSRYGFWVVAAACGLGCSASDDADSGAGTDTSFTSGGKGGSYGAPVSASGGSTSFGTAGGGGNGAYGTPIIAGDTAAGGASNQGDSYEPVGTNPFVIVAHDPLSTFAADVDTASYDIFRRDIADGFLPLPDSVRLEEYVNYFAYDYPAPTLDAEHPFTISLGAAPSLFEFDTTILRIGIQGL
ncbi:MAG TPA: von Willebrand factor type A domain-containing protein, partial [Polyangiaceae bacterium]|nr:von Willebrand factor type A domain-containing protein [Polyangiaceae bacterium]